MVSIIMDGKIYSVVKRISSRGIDLNKVHNINSLSRTIYKKRPSIEFCEKELEILCKDESYSVKTTLLYSGVATSTFTILFGGGIIDFIGAFIIGILTKSLSLFLNKSSLNEFFINSICGALISIYSILLLNLGIIADLNKVVAGSIMLLVPGLSLTNSIKRYTRRAVISRFIQSCRSTLYRYFYSSWNWVGSSFIPKIRRNVIC